MNNLVKKSMYTALWLAFVTSNTISQVLANWASGTPESTFGVNNANTVWSKLENQTLSEAIQTYVNYIMTFLYLIAVWFALWGWFNILTAWGDEEKVKKGKTTLINAAMWLAAIFLASTIINWVINLFTGWTIVN